MTLSQDLLPAIAALPVLVPLLAAAATLVFGRRPRLQAMITLTALSVIIACRQIGRAHV